MRLDHLLSKEHYITHVGGCVPGCAGECSAAGCSGWNIDHDIVPLMVAVSTCTLWVWWKVVAGRGWVSDTLLGPEGSGASLILMANEKPGLSV